ncbi:MAG: hypothetical protein CM15mP18_0040 [Methanobacteriota archaeon]|nr:MAG: hypothetical protein CM15mP18_0040 [Euryarchaeota archaeon]
MPDPMPTLGLVRPFESMRRRVARLVRGTNGVDRSLPLHASLPTCEDGGGRPAPPHAMGQPRRVGSLGRPSLPVSTSFSAVTWPTWTTSMPSQRGRPSGQRPESERKPSSSKR